MQAKTAVAVLLLALMGVQAAVAVNTLRIKVPTPPMAPPSEGSMEAPAASESGDMSTESSAPPADMSESTDVQATRLKGGKNCEDNCDQGDSIEDAVRPVDDWLKSFKKREALGSGNLYSAAEGEQRACARAIERASARACVCLLPWPFGRPLFSFSRIGRCSACGLGRAVLTRAPPRSRCPPADPQAAHGPGHRPGAPG
jgi:hypothetical protein